MKRVVSPKFVVTAAVALFAVALAGCSFGGDSPRPTPDDDNPPSSPSADPSTTSSPGPEPTESQSEIDNQPSPVPDGEPVIPDIFMTTVDTESGVLRVVVMVPGIFEDGGICTVTAVGASGTVIKDGTSVADASATICGEFTFGLADLGSGTARISATYESDDHEGSSAVAVVEIP